VFIEGPPALLVVGFERGERRRIRHRGHSAPDRRPEELERLELFQLLAGKGGENPPAHLQIRPEKKTQRGDVGGSLALEQGDVDPRFAGRSSAFQHRSGRGVELPGVSHYDGARGQGEIAEASGAQRTRAAPDLQPPAAFESQVEIEGRLAVAGLRHEAPLGTGKKIRAGRHGGGGGRGSGGRWPTAASGRLWHRPTPSGRSCQRLPYRSRK
jgi:hypothetical protein